MLQTGLEKRHLSHHCCGRLQTVCTDHSHGGQCQDCLLTALWHPHINAPVMPQHLLRQASVHKAWLYDVRVSAAVLLQRPVLHVNLSWGNR